MTICYLGEYMSESVYQTRVQKMYRISIPKPIRDALDIREGNTVEVRIKKVEK